jgi:hypothetical protein
MRIALLGIALAACQSSDVSRALGARCDLSSECDQECLAPSTAWPGGFCTTICDTDRDCPSDALCIEEHGGVCAFSCTADASCDFLVQSYTCQAIDRHGGGNKVMVCRGA